jgi:hypothetical protein
VWVHELVVLFDLRKEKGLKAQLSKAETPEKDTSEFLLLQR